MRVVLSYTIVGNGSYYSNLQRITAGKECYFCLGCVAVVCCYPHTVGLRRWNGDLPGLKVSASVSMCVFVVIFVFTGYEHVWVSVRVGRLLEFPLSVVHA